jgi:hypothetical protein
MDQSRQEKKPFPVRNFVAGMFGLVLLFGARNKMAGTAKPGGYTELFDTAMIVIGCIGAWTALLWPRNKPPER